MSRKGPEVENSRLEDLGDGASRRAILAERVRNVAVEASAGTGKTHLLTGRVIGMLEAGIPMDRLVVVTFTTAAAAQLRFRIRRAIDASTSLSKTRKIEQMSMVPCASIDTIHGFASSILKRFAHIAGIDPGFAVSKEAFTRREVTRLLDEYLLSLDIKLLDECGSVLMMLGSRLRGIVASLASLPDWFDSPSARLLGHDERELEIEYWLDCMEELVSLSSGAAREDTLRNAIEEAASNIRGALGAPDFAIRLRHLLKPLRGNLGSRRHWGDAARLETARDLADRVKRIMPQAILSSQFIRLVMPLVDDLRRMRRDRRSGLTYEDLLWCCRRALERSDELRRILLSETDHVFIDEFQDTSAVQAEMFRLLLASPSDGRVAGGRLTIVGDRKQSIYGWRAADLPSYRRMQGELERQGALVSPISVSFRSTSRIIDFVNAFGRCLFPGEPLSEESQECSYSDLQALPDAPEGATVEIVETPATASAAERRIFESAWLADFLARERAAGNGSGWAVLMRTRTDLETYVSQLAARGIPFVIDSSRDFKRRLEIGDMRNLLKCLASPSDKLSLAAVLRSPFFGIRDSEITTAFESGLRSYEEPVERAPRTVVDACRMLSALRSCSLGTTAPELLRIILSETALPGVVGASGYDVPRRLANLQYLFEWSVENRELSLADIADMLDEDGEGIQSEIAEPPATPEDPECVVISTIHRAKGLDFDKVVFLATQGKISESQDRDVLASDALGAAGVRFDADLRSASYDRLADRQREMSLAESRRLIYVAITRARSRLIVINDPAPRRNTIAELFGRVLAKTLESSPDVARIIRMEEVRPLAGRPAEGPPISGEDATFPDLAPAAILTGEEVQSSMLLGSCVHAVMEKIDFGDPAGWLDERLPSMILPPEVDRQEVRRLAESFFAIPDLPFEPGACRIVGRELPIVFMDGGRPREQYIDLLVEHGGRLHAMDYKTDSVDEDGMRAALEGHAAKQTSYGTHLARAFGETVEVRISFLRPRKAGLVGVFPPDTRPLDSCRAGSGPARRSGRA